MSKNHLQINTSLSSNRDRSKEFDAVKHFSQDNYKNNYPGCNDFLAEDSPRLYPVTKSELTISTDIKRWLNKMWQNLVNTPATKLHYINLFAK